MNSIARSSQHPGDQYNPEPRLVSVSAFLRQESTHDDWDQEIANKLVGESKLMRDLRRSIRAVARSDESVLITGDSGTGKELIARAIHDLSPRRTKPFVAVNCGALAESLLESELFGHVKGAFTGATTQKKGFFEAASGGTIFLDEFAEMSLSTQQRLLRVLQEGSVRPVGSTDAKEIEIDTRVLVATHHDLPKDISAGKFRSDLYYRVNVLQVRAPALRDRLEDIPALAQHFIRKYNEKNSTQISEHISSDVLVSFETYSWPGNVRELENIIKRLALNAAERRVITQADMANIHELSQPPESYGASDGKSDKEFEVPRQPNCLSTGKYGISRCRCSEELDRYRSCLDQAEGNLAAAARGLGIPRTTLRKRMKILRTKCAG